jgi:putative glutamine amidotransferase
MMIKPRIAIPVPTSKDLAYNQRCWPQYATAVERAGGIAVEVPLGLSPRQIADLINGCQGVLLPGSPADVNPQKYGQEATEACAPADAARENVDELLIQDAHNLYKPILAVCFGLQLLNVWRGGTLLQDLTVLPVNHAAKSSVGTAHTIAVPLDSLLGGMVSREEAAMDGEGEFLRLPINSSHHQAIGIPGDGLRVTARCPQDGVIEAVEGGQAGGQAGQGATAHFVLGLQWHPERSYEQSATSRALFAEFVAAAAAWKPRAVRVSVA